MTNYEKICAMTTEEAYATRAEKWTEEANRLRALGQLAEASIARGKAKFWAAKAKAA